MTRTRGPELSKKLHEYVSTQWMFFGRNAYQISDQINKDTVLMSQFGKTSPPGIHYHVKQIQQEMENSISEDAMDTYIGEFIRARLGFEQDVIALEEIMKDEMDKGMENMDKELYLKFARARHEIKLDSFKMLQDSALPLQVKKLKMERAKLRPARPMPEIEPPMEEYYGLTESEITEINKKESRVTNHTIEGEAQRFQDKMDDNIEEEETKVEPPMEDDNWQQDGERGATP